MGTDAPGAFLPFFMIIGATETNIGVRIRRLIIQIQRERSSVRRVIPIAAALEGVLVLPLLK